MQLYFIRHGESLSNAQKVFSSNVKVRNGLTRKGVRQIKDVAETLPGKVDFVYTSPLQRSVESAEVFIKNRPEKLSYTITELVREIDYGEHEGKKNSSEMDEVSRKQVAGDHEVRFGETGENKREILTRLYAFLVELIDAHAPTDNIVVFSHGRLISILEVVISGVKGKNPQSSSTDNAAVKQFMIDLSDRELFRMAIERLKTRNG